MTDDALQPGTRVCVECRQPWQLGADEIARLHVIADRAGWPFVRPPKRCAVCRAAARRAQFTEEAYHADANADRRCSECSAVFTWPTDEGERRYFSERGWPAPRRCEPCREARRGAIL
jgi:hypothetical protein